MRPERHSSSIAITRAQRMDALFDLINQGLNARQIHEQLPPMKKRIRGPHDNSETIGEESEGRVFGLLRSHHLVRDIIKAPESQEAIDGIVKFIDGFSRQSVAIQVKTSQLGVDLYFDEEHFQAVTAKYGDILVINGGPAVTNDQIYSQFEEQLIELGYLDKSR